MGGGDEGRGGSKVEDRRGRKKTGDPCPKWLCNGILHEKYLQDEYDRATTVYMGCSRCNWNTIDDD